MGTNLVVCDAEFGRYYHHPARTSAAVFTPNGRSLVTSIQADQEEGLCTWDLGSLLEARPSEFDKSKALFISGPEALELVGTRLDGVQVSLSSRYQDVADCDLDTQSGITALSISSDGLLAASASLHNNLTLWDLAAGRVAVVLRGCRLSNVRLPTTSTLRCFAYPFTLAPRYQVSARIHRPGRMSDISVWSQRNLQTLRELQAGIW